jgi:hypothetical protein
MDDETSDPKPVEYVMQVDGRMSRCEGVSSEGALKMAKNEAERLHKTVWLYETTGAGFFLKAVCKPPHKYIKRGTFKFSTERALRKRSSDGGGRE